MEHNKLAKIHDWFVRIVVAIVMVLVIISLWFTFIKCANPSGLSESMEVQPDSTMDCLIVKNCL